MSPRLPTVCACLLLAVLLLGGCGRTPPQALGTLEYDRITLPAVASERLVAVQVREGQRVQQGQPLLQLDPTRLQAELAASQAQASRQQALLQELLAGPRQEDIERARSTLGAARAEARKARDYYARVRPLEGQSFVSAADLDAARAAAEQTADQEQAARATLAALEHGTRPEQIAQARAALEAARAQAQAQRIMLDKLHVVAPRAGLIDSLPYKLGDQAPVGAPLAVLLVGAAPYARIYVPAPHRLGLHEGDAVTVHVQGRDRALTGHVRMLRGEPVFTPYYALTGEDATRLSYLAEVDLGPQAGDLPAGVPVRVDLPADNR